MKAILMAGGSGTRLYPITYAVNKHLLPIYDKPMIYYSLSIPMLAGIRDILIISDPYSLDSYKKLFGDGSQWGLHIEYAAQRKPKGIAEGLIIGENFLDGDSVCMVLGDNILYGHDFPSILKEARENIENNKYGAVVFGYYVKDPERYGIVEFDSNDNPTSIVEKPKKPKSNYAVIGVYFYDSNAPQIAKNIEPSWRNELEITDVNNEYLKRGKLKVIKLGRGFAWLDTGTYDSLIEASIFVKTLEERMGLKISCPEEIAYRKGFISKEQLKKLGNELSNTSYGKYLLNLI
ncbi:glucose-1-phosphate thymidylyltransferase RfbA [Candidatus Aciduliprofundum boonei]|uniref:glucose-1-phosphate thymidylyltransferase n=1 Tax=Aciduliprofundum boonei (strain DSM 19572 / T469) TaxID=439481 RepID=B5IDJ4_ACIB4|nr:glucose-1-phosphate thymidylyltransferase RfbA [Candidatus Aciduliprofundum boonei]ADD08069.1 glucose-1-phosphate thymidylyltransferase [Aciduliprofundum boonei T469]EDY35585.1 glucose-1-phosphate thymidylyltransferase [Aciduliprofundum boonei T469]